MGYIRHHAIVVTSWDNNLLEIVHRKAVELFGVRVSNVTPSKINGYVSFFVAPDGSKEGWGDSDNGDYDRSQLIEFIKSQAYEDGSNAISFAELFYGDDEGQSEIVTHN